MRKLHFGIAAATGAALLSVATVQAQNGPALGTADASSVTAGSYTMDSGHTLVGWTVNHFGFNDYFGIFGSITGTLTLDPADTSATSLEVTIPVSKLTTANEGLTAHMLRDGADGAAPDFFGAAPADATFKSTEVRSTGENQALITGMLTLNGVSKPVSFMAEFTGAGKNPFTQKETIGFKGWGQIKRSDFNVNYAVPLVSDEVQLNITAAFEK